MPRYDRKTCQQCGRHASVVGPISHGGLCGDCGTENLLENVDGLHDKTGMPWMRWKVGTALRVFESPAIVKALMDAGAFGDLDDHRTAA